MSQTEIYGTRDLTYSKWHRIESVQRFVTPAEARELAMIDNDVILYTEYHDKTKKPCCLIETAIDVGQDWKAGTVTMNLAKMAKIPALVTLYTISGDDILSFRVRFLFPVMWKKFIKKTPEEYAKMLLELRNDNLSQAWCLE